MNKIEFGHPLHGADLRLARARRLIGTMRGQYLQWAKANRDTGFHQRFDRATGHLDLSPVISDAKHVYLPRIAITLGETTYNIRSALDYLVYSIARANNKGKEVSGTQFPIETSKDRYWMRWTGKDPKTGRDVPKWLHKIPEEVAKDLAQYQPFSHCRWAELLRDLSNPDKHRHLTTLSTTATFVPARPPLRVIDTDANTQTIHLRGQLEISVLLPTGEDIIDALHLVQGEARALIGSYASRFHRDPIRFD